MKNVCERLALCQLNEHMNVIRHHHKCIQQIPVTIEMPQRANYNCRCICFFENALAMSLIEPLFTVVLKSFLVFVLRGSIPGFGMKLSPGFYFFFPSSKNALRDCIGQSESHEVRRIRLFPMWQVSSVFLNFPVPIHGMKLRVTAA